MIRNLTRDRELAERAVEAKSLFSRMRGMLGRRFDGFDAMIFPRNNSVHTCFMGISIDVVFVDAAGVVVSAKSDLKPWRMAGCMAGKTTIELPAGALQRTGTVVGDQLEIVADRTI